MDAFIAATAQVHKLTLATCNLADFEFSVDVIVNPCLDASIGISVFPKDGASAAALIQRADDAMYGAKENKSGFAFAQ